MIGRHLFDTTNGWDGNPAAETASSSPTGHCRAVARRPPGRTVPHRRLGRGRHRARQETRGDGLVCVTAGDLGGQAFQAGLVDEIAMDVAPVVLGEGVRFFGSHTGTVLLDDPDQVVQGDRVLHLHYTVKR